MLGKIHFHNDKPNCIIITAVGHRFIISTHRTNSSCRTEIFRPRMSIRKKQIDQLLGTIDALLRKSLVKHTNAEMENALLKERKNQELKNKILGHIRKEYQLEQQKKNFEKKILSLDKKNEILLSNFIPSVKIMKFW